MYVYPARAVYLWAVCHILWFSAYVWACSYQYRRALNQKDEFMRLLTEHSLWPDLTRVLSWYICLLSKRDDVLVARSAYSVIREFLIEINELIIHHNRDINVYDYIQEYTNFARSTIIKILSDLKKETISSLRKAD